MRVPIRYDLIAHAIDWYRSRGTYDYVEVPWIVGRPAVDATLPPGHEPYMTTGGALVGSAEQSFVEMFMDGQLKPGRHLAASPCFRDDPVDHLHQNTFFKVELIYLGLTPFSPDHVWAMAGLARQFFRALPGGHDAQIIETEKGLDITLRGVELGSYGLRSFGSWHWVYGTGIAEPRFTIASKL
jgi:hypothetical protein